MEYNNIAYFSYLGGGIIFAALALTFLYLWQQKKAHFSLVIASVASVLWSSSIAVNNHDYTLGLPALILLETVRYSCWIFALIASIKFASGQRLPLRFSLIIHGIWVISLLLILVIISNNNPISEDTNLLIWNSLILSILGLISVEQLYRNTRHNRLMKLLSVTVGSIFVYDIYLFSYSLIFNLIDSTLWQSRGAVNGAAALITALGSLAIANYSGEKTNFAISRPVAFYTTSMTFAGCFLGLMAIGGYYVQLYGGSWGTIVQVLVIFSALIAIAVVFVSHTVRSRLNVWINKNFFRHKYDYRVEWLKLINYLSQPTDDEDFHQRAIKAIASIFKSPGGCLWLEINNRFVPTHAYNMPLPRNKLIESIDTPFCQTMLEQEWVFSPYAPGNDKLSALNNLLPGWIYEITDLWLILPLLTEKKLIGFIALAKPRHDTSLTWEDLDLLKASGRQVASYLDRHKAAELIAESRQFDTFNKLTAFIMHDLKNLIAQQALVVENAAKHKENPDFVEDAIKTIENSVNRMSNLLRKLQHNGPSEVRSLNLQKTLMEVIKKCHDIKPTPSLRFEADDIRINADPDYLAMTLANIIKNAQEATDNNGFVDVTLCKNEDKAIIIIEDNGTGMDEDFIRNRLFKPFDTTKSGKGMGIGVYQTQEFISSLNGSISVESIPGQGTTFTISIPTSAI